MAKKSFTFSASLIATLKERIITWKYPPEHRLTEDALCREFGVSRSPVREALRVLATNGFVRRAANEAAALAWDTRFPLLVFPGLFEEKAANAVRQVQRQLNIRSRSRQLLFV